MTKLIMFAILAVIILGSAIFCVSTKRIMRAATALLFILFGVAGIYFLLDYTFLGATQISIYAGGITMMYIFAIHLVNKRTLQGLSDSWSSNRNILAALISLIGFAVIVFILLKNRFIDTFVQYDFSSEELSMDIIGNTLMSSGKYGYVLPFEFISIFLLACIIGGLVILNINKKKTEE